MLIILLFHVAGINMVRTRAGRGRGQATALPEPNVPAPSPETILILRSLEAINETLRGLAQRGSATSEVEVDAPPLREEVPVVEVSAVPRNPHQDIKRELQKIRLP